MATEVKVPALGESITSGILSAWHVQSGQYVEKGQPIYDLETDKITSEGTAESAGTIELQVEEGDEVEIGAVVAIIDGSAEKPSGVESGSDEVPEQAEQDEGTLAQHPPSVRRIAAESGISPESVDGSGKGGRVTKQDMQEAIQKADTVHGTWTSENLHGAHSCPHGGRSRRRRHHVPDG